MGKLLKHTPLASTRSLMILNAAFLAMLASTDAYYWLSPTTTRHYTSWYFDHDHQLWNAGRGDVETAPSPYWQASPDAYTLVMRLPDIEPETVSAALASD